MTGLPEIPDIDVGRSRTSGAVQRVRSLVLGNIVTDAASVVWTSGSLLLAQVLLAANGLISARLLGPGAKGLATGVLTWMQLLIWASSTGLSIATLVKLPPRCPDGLESRDTIGVALGNAVMFTCVAGAMVTLAGAAFLPRTLAHLGPTAGDLVLVAVVTVPIGMLGVIASAVQLALGRRVYYNAAQISNAMVMTLVTIGLAVATRLTAGGVVAAAIAGTVVSTMVASRGLPWTRLAIELKTLRHDLRFGLWAQLGSFFRLTNLRLDYLVMSAALPARELGLYATANNVLLPLFTLPAAVSLLLAVKVSNATDSTVGAGARRVALISAEAWRYSLIALFGGILIGAASIVAVPFLLGNAYRDSVGLIWILLPGSVLFCYTTIATAGAVAMQRVWVGIAAEAAAAVATLLLLPFLLPGLEAVGAAITSSIAYGLSAAAAAIGLSVLRARSGHLDFPS